MLKMPVSQEKQPYYTPLDSNCMTLGSFLVIFYYVTRCNQVWPNVTGCDQVWLLWPWQMMPVTTCIQPDTVNQCF